MGSETRERKMGMIRGFLVLEGRKDGCGWEERRAIAYNQAIYGLATIHDEQTGGQNTGKGVEIHPGIRFINHYVCLASFLVI